MVPNKTTCDDNRLLTIIDNYANGLLIYLVNYTCANNLVISYNYSTSLKI